MMVVEVEDQTDLKEKIKGRLKRIFVDSDFDSPVKIKKYLGPIPGFESYLESKRRLQARYDELAEATEFIRLCHLEPLLRQDQEFHLFRKYNCYKFLAGKAYDQEDLNEACLNLKKSDAVKRHIVEANIRCAVGFLKVHIFNKSHDDFISEAIYLITRAVDYFDWTRNLKFSTYITWCFNRSLNRMIMDENNQATKFKLESEIESNFTSSPDDVNERFLDSFSGRDDEFKDELRISHLRVLIDDLLHHCDDRQAFVLKSRFFMDRTLQEIADKLSISKERVRQIEADALNLIRCVCKHKDVNIDSVSEPC